MAANTATRTTLPAKFEENFWEDCDQRLGAVKEIKRRYETLLADTGADCEQKRMLVQHCVYLHLKLQTMQQRDASNEEPLDFGRYTQGLNALTGILRSLGLDKKLKPAGVPDLSTYLQGRVT